VQPDAFALPAFILSIVSLVVAVIGALTGVVALIWQINTRTRGAHRVAVNVANSVFVGPSSPDGVMICVEAINSGASPVKVTSWGFALPNRDGTMAATIPFPHSAPLPHVLDPGTNAEFFMPAVQLGHGLRQRPSLKPSDLKAFVSLATGEKVFTKRRGVPLADEFWQG
jgi:hypothetical protein